MTSPQPPRRFTPTALSRRDGVTPWTLPPSHAGLNPTGRARPCRRNDVELPTVNRPSELPDQSTQTISEASLTPTRAMSRTSSSEPAWYWLSDAFFVDLSPAFVNPDSGWQYAQSFDTPDEDWT